MTNAKRLAYPRDMDTPLRAGAESLTNRDKVPWGTRLAEPGGPSPCKHQLHYGGSCMKASLGTLGAALIGWLGLSSQVLAAPPIGAPEIDATGALTALAMLSGVLAVVAERKRQKKQ